MIILWEVHCRPPTITRFERHPQRKVRPEAAKLHELTVGSRERLSATKGIEVRAQVPRYGSKKRNDRRNLRSSRKKRIWLVGNLDPDLRTMSRDRVQSKLTVHAS